jgi:hypothetical protein
MKLPLPNIKLKTFYMMGGCLMSVSLLGNIIAQYIQWEAYNIGNKISGVASIFFTLMWMGFFIFLYKNAPEMPSKVVNSPEIDELLNNLKEEDNGKKRE